MTAAIGEGTQEALQMPMPDPGTATDRLFYEADDDLLLGDGVPRWSGFTADREEVG